MGEVADILLNKFKSISLTDLGEDALLTRRDTKFVFNNKEMEKVLDLFADRDWKILEVGGVRNQFYNSVYLDTADYECYNHHHNNRANRKKFRFRRYQNGTSFFEIKTKNNKGITEKERCLVDSEEYTQAVKIFVNKGSALNPESLEKNICVSYHRITLFHSETNEKITIDTGVQITFNEVVFKLDTVAILELKQEQFNKNLDTKRLLQDLGLLETGLSKYCIGIMECVPNVKHNQFKRKFRMLEKIGKAS